RRARRLRPLPQPPVRPLDERRVLRVRRPVRPHRLPRPRQQAEGRPRQARVRRRADRLPEPRRRGDQPADEGPGEAAIPRRPHAPPRPDVGADRLGALASWVAAPDNPFFAKAQVNRIWLHLMGRGLVDPNDDFRATNPPSNPELLDWLARDFAAGGFRLKRM